MLFKKRIKSHVFEKIIATFLVLFGLSAAFLFIQASKFKTITSGQIVLMELILIVIMILLANSLVIIKIYEKVE